MDNQTKGNFPNQEEKKKDCFKFVWRIFFFVVLSVGLLVLGITFLFIPNQVHQGDNVLFKDKGYYLSEKVTYLFRPPKVGDRVIFVSPQQLFSKFVGLIVEKKEERNLRSYYILASQDSSRPWVVSVDKIKSKIYFPLSSMETVDEILADMRWKITPTPAPLRLPIAGEPVLYDQPSPPRDWVKFESADKKYNIFHPKNLKEGINSDGINVSFLLEDNLNGANYLEIFIKKISLQPGEDIGRAIYIDTALPSVPTFEQILINGSVSGYQISRSVDNLSRYLKTIYLPSENAVYSISMRTPLPINSTYKEIFEKVVGSFKITN